MLVQRGSHVVFSIFLCVTMGIFVLSLALGQFEVTPFEVLVQLKKGLLSWFGPVEVSPAYHVVNHVRLPRVILAAGVGCGLSMSGALFQMIFSNPLVSPGLLGATNGAAFGAALALLFQLSRFQVMSTAFVIGVVSMVLVFFLAESAGQRNTLGLVLCGLVVSTLFSAGVSLLKLNADPYNTLPSITYWLMGSLAGAQIGDLSWMISLFPLSMAMALLGGWRLNIMALGDRQAQSLGMAIVPLRFLLVSLATLTVSLCVSLSGVIGWVGLMVPHMARWIVGDDARKFLPLCGLVGASFLMVVDDVARLALSQEIPLGILTAFLGAPLYIGLIRSKGARHEL